MPELPEVETIARALERQLSGQLCRSVDVLTPSIVQGKPDLFRSALRGRRLLRIYRHGKTIFAAFEKRGKSPSVLHIHLGMTGQLLFEPRSLPMAPHTHVRFVFEGQDRELRYRDIRRFGWLDLAENDHHALGPDAWLAEPATLFTVLRGRSGMAKAVLMNQAIIAGLGNIYVDESLFRAGIHPQARLDGLPSDRVLALCEAIRIVLGESIDLGGTSFRNYVDTEGGRGGFKGRLKVYGKEGTPCPVCGHHIQKFTMGGRGTHWCPGCQVASRPKRRRR